ncbi:OCIA domain-containing protein 1 [Solenopsis invicta]|uniref:OCIA domain-containing protein 1 n=1 Tax=Solenopsis invicta TaxID=13686 RepID=UPI00193D4BF5|nr:OCIA domain-containing protein 1 [Solenopsis invicta]XP_011172395.2 OCIA domain-containing protein 1 [Solenopsis invicta]
MTTTDVQQPNYKHRQAQMRLELTPEEAKAWQTCMRSSSVLMPTLITAAMGYGVCRISPFRAYAKYVGLVSGVVGLITGRIAVSEACLAKVASMPNSNLRDRLIEAGYYGFKPIEKQQRGFQPMSMQTEIQSQAEPSTEIVFDDYPPMNSYDTYSSINEGDLPLEETDLTEPMNMQKGVSYDELRQKNRDEFYRKNYTPRTPREPPVARQATEQVPTAKSPSPQEKTKYGDVWD